MKLSKTRSSITEEKAFEGIITLKVNHQIKESSGDLNYSGPKISPEVWHRLISFLKWSYDTTKSEAQARLFLNYKTQQWEAWAFPQKASQGMSAEELPSEQCQDVIEQRAKFSDADGWLYFGTVHHHCSGKAFQSGTDENNEKNQDGLHITLGDMDTKQHDMHCRLYVGGLGFEPDMSLFWDIGDEVRHLVPERFWDEIARYQMGHASSVEFPPEWKANLIEVKKEPYKPVDFRGSGGMLPWENPNATGWGTSSYKGLRERAAEGALEFYRHIPDDTCIEWALQIDSLMSDPEFLEIVRICKRQCIDLDDFAVDLARLVEQAKEMSGQEDDPKTKGNGKTKIKVKGKKEQDDKPPKIHDMPPDSGMTGALGSYMD